MQFKSARPNPPTGSQKPMAASSSYGPVNHLRALQVYPIGQKIGQQIQFTQEQNRSAPDMLGHKSFTLEHKLEEDVSSADR